MKSRWLTALTARIASFRAAQEAVAIVEFALTVPLLLFLYLGSVEISQMITADRKVTIVAGTVGDLVARTKDTISQTGALADYFLASRKIMMPFSTARLKQIVSSVYIDASGNPTIKWSKAYNDADAASGKVTAAHTVGAYYELSPAMLAIAARKSYVIVSEASYSYPVMNGIVFDHDIMLYRENFYIPRFGDAITLDP